MSELQLAYLYNTKVGFSKEVVKNCAGFHHVLWQYLEGKYLPKMEYSRLVSGEGFDELWDLQDSDELSDYERTTFRMTLDRAYCPVKKLPEVSECFLKMHNDLREKQPDSVSAFGELSELFSQVDKRHHHKLIGVGVNCSSSELWKDVDILEMTYSLDNYDT